MTKTKYLFEQDKAVEDYKLKCLQEQLIDLNQSFALAKRDRRDPFYILEVWRSIQNVMQQIVTLKLEQ